MELSFFEKILAESFILVYMLATGLISQKGEVLDTLKDKMLIVKALLFNFVIIPMLALLLAWLFISSIEIKTGIILLGICPGGLFTLNFVRVSNGNIRLAIALFCLFSVMGIFFTPIFVWFLAGFMPDLLFSFWIICRLIMLVLIPLFWGRLLAIYLPRSKSWAIFLEILSIIIFIVFNLLTIALKSQALAVLEWNAILVMMLMVLAGWILGFWFGGTDSKNKKTFAISTSMRNVAFCYPFALHQFANTNVIVPVIAFSGLSITMNLALVLILKYWKMHGRID